MNSSPRTVARLLALPLVFAAASLSGCVAAGWLADGVAGGDRAVNVQAEYLGLEAQRVAVVVDTDVEVSFRHPLAQFEVASVISERIAANVPNVSVRDPQQIIDFQQRNLYWNTARYSELMERLEVDRLVLIELVDYRLHEPGNVNIWRGLMTANLGVAEAESESPDDLVYATTVSVRYPPDREEGLLRADQRTMRLATLDLFSRAAAGKFYDHKSARR